jgi:polygalacturonase
LRRDPGAARVALRRARLRRERRRRGRRAARDPARDLRLRHSPSWNVHLWGCEQVVIQRLDIRSSLTEAVWSDGIDPDGCKDVRIA